MPAGRSRTARPQRSGPLRPGPKRSGPQPVLSPAPGVTFAALGVPAPLVAVLAEDGITVPRPIQAAVLPDDAPRYPASDGMVKTSAAWLIDHAGFHRGFSVGRARVSTKHTLALTNPGDATADDIAALAREIRAGVRQRFGVLLAPEPVLVGVDLG